MSWFNSQPTLRGLLRNLTEAVAVAGDVDDVAAVQEPVEHGDGNGGVAEDVAEDVAPGVGAVVILGSCPLLGDWSRRIGVGVWRCERSVR